MTSSERKIFEAISKVTPHPMYYLPLVWTGSVVSRARAEGRVRDDFAMKTIIDELNDIMRKLGDLLSYDWISVPLVYTQVGLRGLGGVGEGGREGLVRERGLREKGGGLRERER